MKETNIFWAMPKYHGLRIWWNLKLPYYVMKRLMFTLKHGYPPQATWEFCSWFPCIMDDILDYFLKTSIGMPMIVKPKNDTFDEAWEEENQESWNHILKEMKYHLQRMNEDWYEEQDYDWDKQSEAITYHKKKFFEYMEKYFFNFWD